MNPEKIEDLLDIIKAVNIVHFPQGIVIRRHESSGWEVRVVNKVDGFSSSIGRGDTPEAAWLSAIAHIKRVCEERKSRAQREADAAAELSSRL